MFVSNSVPGSASGMCPYSTYFSLVNKVPALCKCFKRGKKKQQLCFENISPLTPVLHRMRVCWGASPTRQPELIATNKVNASVYTRPTALRFRCISVQLHFQQSVEMRVKFILDWCGSRTYQSECANFRSSSHNNMDNKKFILEAEKHQIVNICIYTDLVVTVLSSQFSCDLVNQ